MKHTIEVRFEDNFLHPDGPSPIGYMYELLEERDKFINHCIATYMPRWMRWYWRQHLKRKWLPWPKSWFTLVSVKKRAGGESFGVRVNGKTYWQNDQRDI